MELEKLVPGMIGAFVGVIGWLFVGIYIQRRQFLRQARMAARAVYCSRPLSTLRIGASRIASRSSATNMPDFGGQAIVLRPGNGRLIDLGTFAMSVKATPEDTGGAFSLLEADEPAGFGPPLHIHHGTAEAFYVLAGEYVVFVEDQEFACPSGSFIFIPAETPHSFRVGSVRSRKLNLYTPAAMVGYFDEVSAAGAIDPGALSEIAERYGMEVIGPVPEGYT